MTERTLSTPQPSFWSRWVSPVLALVVVVLVVKSRTHDPLTLLLVGYVVASALSTIAPIRARPRLARILSTVAWTACILFLLGFLIRYGRAIL